MDIKIFVGKRVKQLQHAIEYFKFPIKCVQTDNGQEFTKYFGHDKRRETDPTLFQRVLCVNGIVHKQSRAYTPRHNGKVPHSYAPTRLEVA